MGYGRYSYYNYGFAPYVSVAQKQARAKKKLEQLRKKNPGIRPVVVEGRTLAHTWWGKAWNQNLERYADFSNRVGRGRSYVRSGAVLDMQISAGEVRALVQGSASNPYKVRVKIDAVAGSEWKRIVEVCAQRIGSMQELLAGRFPKDLIEAFTTQGGGLFPTPKQISFDCSCPDWASMCKHVAAVLYGIGTRLDEEPQLFFVLRKARIEDLISKTLRDTSDRMLKRAATKTGRVIDDADLGDVFGIEMEGPIPAHAPTEHAPAKAVARRKAGSKAAAKSAQKKPSGTASKRKLPTAITRRRTRSGSQNSGDSVRP